MENSEKEPDTMRELCIEQGYVPAKCKLPGFVIYAATQKDGDACKGCNLNRDECGGRPKG